QHVFIVATGVLKSISQDRHSVKRTVLVNALCEGSDIRREPRGVHGDGAKWIAEGFVDKPDQTFMLRLALCRRLVLIGISESFGSKQVAEVNRSLQCTRRCHESRVRKNSMKGLICRPSGGIAPSCPKS